jgi:putative membrane protein
VSAIATALYGVATTVYMPSLVARYTSEFGLFGITIAIVGWLLAISVVLVASASIGAEFDRSRAHWALVTKQRFGLVDPALEPLTPLGPDEVSGLSGSDVLLLMRVLVNWLVIAAAVWVAAAIVPGIEVRGGFGTLLWVSLLLGLVNAVLGPVLWFVAMPLSVLTVGLSALVVNGVLLAVTAGLSDNLDVGGFGGTVLGALLISGVTTLLELVLRPISRLGLSRPAGASGAAGRGRDGS